MVTSWVVVQKIYSKMHLASCTNNHRDVTDLVNHGMFKDTKTWISWERDIIFLRSKKILNLCLRCHIFRSYHFVAEVTFKVFVANQVQQMWESSDVLKWHYIPSKMNPADYTSRGLSRPSKNFNGLIGFDLIFQKWFVSFLKENKHKTDVKCNPPRSSNK